MSAILDVRVIPLARRSGIAGTRDNAVLIRLNAPPVDGAANDALIAFLSHALGVPRRDIALIAGEKSRDKRVRVSGLTDATARERLRNL